MDRAYPTPQHARRASPTGLSEPLDTHRRLYRIPSGQPRLSTGEPDRPNTPRSTPAYRGTSGGWLRIPALRSPAAGMRDGRHRAPDVRDTETAKPLGAGRRASRHERVGGTDAKDMWPSMRRGAASAIGHREASSPCTGRNGRTAPPPCTVQPETMVIHAG